MANQVSMGAVLKCSMGQAPSTLVVLPKNKVMGEFPPAANIKDHLPLVNILPFGMCKSMRNPAVIAATAANLGKMTPMPCVPATTKPWKPGSPKVLIAKQPSLQNKSKCNCLWGGVIQIQQPATVQIRLP